MHARKAADREKEGKKEKNLRVDGEGQRELKKSRRQYREACGIKVKN